MFTMCDFIGKVARRYFLNTQIYLNTIIYIIYIYIYIYIYMYMHIYPLFMFINVGT